jgi:hypothetical protein
MQNYALRFPQLDPDAPISTNSRISIRVDLSGYESYGSRQAAIKARTELGAFVCGRCNTRGALSSFMGQSIAGWKTIRIDSETGWT